MQCDKLARHWCMARCPLKKCMGTLSTSTTCIIKAPSHWSMSSSTQRSLSALTRCKGLSPIRAQAHTLNCGPVQVIRLKSQMPVQEHQYCSRGSKTLPYHLKGVSNMSPLVPPWLLICCHLKPSYARFCVVKALPPFNALLASTTLKAWRKQGESRTFSAKSCA
jgi:hypothetical protein